MKRRLMSILGIFLTFVIGDAFGQGYPSKPIRFIVPYATGGGTDIVARAVGDELSRALNVAVIVDNRPGAGSTLGTGLAAAAAPDGYTIVLSSSSMTMAATLYKKLPYDTLHDFEPVSLVASQPDALVVNPKLPVRSVKELIEYAKAHPDSIAYASGGIGSANHMATELFELMAGVKLMHVPYKGTGPAVVDLLGGQVQMTISVVASLVPYIKNKKLIPLAVTGASRSPALPDVPTMDEAGVRGYEFTTWYGIQLPAKTPVAIVQKLHAAIVKVMASSKIHEHYAAEGLDPITSTPAQFHTLIVSDLKKWAKVINTAHITVE